MATTEVEMLTSGASGRVRMLLSVRAWRAVVGMLTAVALFIMGPWREQQKRREKVVVDEKEKEKTEKTEVATVVRLPSAIVPRRMAVDQEVAVRRALAIRRVRDDMDDDGKCKREFSLFVSPRNGGGTTTLFTQSWSPLGKSVRGLVVLLHGLNEHSGRYSEFAKQLNDVGIKVYGMDWIDAHISNVTVHDTLIHSHGYVIEHSDCAPCGAEKVTCEAPHICHGGSDGLHAYVPSLDDAVSDMKAFLDKVLSENPGLPCFCFAHSTGAAIVLKAVLDPKVQDRVHGVVLTSPAVGVKPSHPIFSVIAPIVSFLFPRYQCQAANKPGTVVSRDPEALRAKYSDPLVYTGAIRIRTGCEILRISAHLQQHLTSLSVPFFVLHGSADAVTDPEGSKKLYEEASSTDKSIKLYDGLLHDLLFEPERQTIVKDIMDWLNQRIEQ